MKNNLFYWLFGISILLSIFDYYTILSGVKNPLEVFAVSIKGKVFGSYAAINNFSSLVMQYSNIKRIFEERELLKRTNEEMKITVEILKEENTKLRYQLQAPLPSSYQFIPAQVVGVTRFMELAAGTDSGIKEGMAVVDEATLIGRIATPSRFRSTVMLPWDAEINIPAKTSRGAKGIVVGQLGEKIILDKVLQKEQLFLGDQVFTSGEGGFPPNLLIGKISHITTDDISVYKTAQISGAIDYKKERMVFVIPSI